MVGGLRVQRFRGARRLEIRQGRQELRGVRPLLILASAHLGSKDWIELMNFSIGFLGFLTGEQELKTIFCRIVDRVFDLFF